MDSAETVWQLFKKWDDLDLLVIHPRSAITTGDEGRVKIFNAWKSLEHDRQIGDRRERNAWEGRLRGPSAHLPVGSLITKIVVPEGCGLKTCVTDRSDYYHQIGVSLERSRSNIVWPPMPLKDFVQFKAYKNYVERASQKKRKVDRTVHGDDLSGFRHDAMPIDPEAEMFGSFRAILQGDHLGVEFGISAHVGLLQSVGLLADRGRPVTSSLIRPSSVYQGLCIDDFFCLAPVPLSELYEQTAKVPSAAKKAFDLAKKCYKDQQLQGSDHKDVIDQCLTAVVGAEVDSRPQVVEKGMLPVGAPASKRLALSWISAMAARYPCTTDALHSSLMGALISAFCFRRCSMSILVELFKVIPPGDLNTEKPKLHPLTRSAAEELILAAVLLPIVATDVKAPFSEWIFASDASNAKGAYVVSKIPPSLAEPLWQAGDFKGGYTRLDTGFTHALRKSGIADHDDWKQTEAAVLGFELAGDETLLAQEERRVPRPFAQSFDFLEVCGGSGVVSEQLAKMGFVVGPIIDISFSPHYNLLDSRTVEWILFMVQNRRVRALGLEPPCTTFSAAAYPPCRSYRVPRGFNQKSPKVWNGNRLAFACMQIFLACIFSYVVALLETPRRSKMAWLQEWLRLLRYENVEETFTSSCAYGSVHQKEFRFLTCNMKSSSICKPCSRDHPHMRIEGGYTKQSAVYCPGLALALAQLFAKHLRAQTSFFEKHDLRAEGLESVFVNELMNTCKWYVGSVWKWVGPSHINVLEIASALKAIKAAAFRGGGRVCLLLDSNVAVRAIAKGRSSARSLTKLLQKIGALALCFGVYLSVHFCPTRLNVSDDPTRDVELRPPNKPKSFLRKFDEETLFRLAELPKLRRWISNWILLFLGICTHHHIPCANLQIQHPRLRSSSPPVDFYHHLLDFDSTLGFPGEGPVGRWILLLAVVVVLSHGMLPRHPEDELRAAKRRQNPLAAGRPVLQVTRTNREKLLEAFGLWLAKQGHDLQLILSKAYVDPEAVVSFLVAYGKELYASGRPYSHYAETINAVAAAKPTIRRLLTGAWDLAFSWIKEEPGEHHTACPFQVLLAMLSVSILWGWPLVAGAIALSWGAVCRIGEVLQAVRGDLVIPADVHFSNLAVYLKVQEPKTRYKAARHQMSKLDYSDLVDLVSCVYGRVALGTKLWPFSPQLMRTRFKQLLTELGLGQSTFRGEKALDLGSLRAGGATHLLMVSEDAELVRRRGRWLAARTMDIYIQEIAATVYFPRLPENVKDKIMKLAMSFPALLSQMKSFTTCGIPPAAWYILLLANKDGNGGTKHPGKAKPQDEAFGKRSNYERKAEKKDVEQLTTVVTLR